MMQFLQLVQFILVLVVSLPFAVLPLKISLKLGEILGILFFYFWRSRRKIAVENIQGAITRGAITTSIPAPSIIKQNFKNLGKSVAEIIKVHYGFGDGIIRDIKISGEENLEKALQKQAGVIMITGHCGNWELIGLPIAATLTKMNVVVRKINNPYLDRMIVSTREKYGNKMIYKDGALKKILGALKKNEAVGLLIDQSVVSTEGVITDFLGKKAYTLKTPAIIARKTGSPVLTGFIRRTENGHSLEIGKEIELDKSEDHDTAVFNDTVKFNTFIEDYIRQNPTEWLWIHRRWKRIKE